MPHTCYQLHIYRLYFHPVAAPADHLCDLQCRQEVAGHISWLQRKREMDPYKGLQHALEAGPQMH